MLYLERYLLSYTLCPVLLDLVATVVHVIENQYIHYHSCYKTFFFFLVGRAFGQKFSHLAKLVLSHFFPPFLQDTAESDTAALTNG